MKTQATLTLVLVGFILAAGVHADLILWNKLGLDYEVLNSEIGEDGTLLGTVHAYEPGQHWNGYVRKATGEEGLQFPGSVLHDLSSRGTVELWINPKVPNPVPFQYGFFALVGRPNSSPSAPDNRGNVYLYWGDGVTGRGFYGGIRFDGMHARTPDEPTQFVATPAVPVHAAISWDIDGIDGTADTVRVYRDGALVGATADLWNPEGMDLEDNFLLGMSPDAGGYDKWISDNIKVWDFAETDFSHRFDEYWVPEPGMLGLLGVGALALLRRRGTGGPAAAGQSGGV